MTKSNGTFGTWTSNFDGEIKEVGLYRDNNGNVEKRLFKTVRAALEYGFDKGYEIVQSVPYHQFLLGEYHRVKSHDNL